MTIINLAKNKFIVSNYNSSHKTIILNDLRYIISLGIRFI